MEKSLRKAMPLATTHFHKVHKLLLEVQSWRRAKGFSLYAQLKENDGNGKIDDNDWKRMWKLRKYEQSHEPECEC